MINGHTKFELKSYMIYTLKNLGCHLWNLKMPWKYWKSCHSNVIIKKSKNVYSLGGRWRPLSIRINSIHTRICEQFSFFMKVQNMNKDKFAPPFTSQSILNFSSRFSAAGWLSEVCVYLCLKSHLLSSFTWIWVETPNRFTRENKVEAAKIRVSSLSARAWFSFIPISQSFDHSIWLPRYSTKIWHFKNTFDGFGALQSKGNKWYET